MSLERDENTMSEPADPSRRNALKIGASVAVGAAVWAEPTIRGLATRPAYAQAGSCTPTSGTIMAGAFSGSNIASGQVLASLTLADGSMVDLIFTIPSEMGSNATYCIETSPPVNITSGTATVNGSGGPIVNLSSDGTSLCGDTTNSLSNIKDIDWAALGYTTICP